MELVHLSDTHLGRNSSSGIERKRDYARAFESVIDDAVERDVEAVIHSGDLFDSPSPSIETLERTDETIQKLTDNGIPFIVIVGNHERKRSLQWVDFLSRNQDLRRLSRDPMVISDDEDEEQIVLYGIDAVRKPLWDSADFTLTAPSIDSQTAPRMLFMHELVSPPINKGIEDYELSEIVPRLKLDIDFLALGDYHDPINEYVEEFSLETYYAGATERINRNDFTGETEPSYVLLTVEDNEVTYERVPVKYTRPYEYVTIEEMADKSISEVKSEIDGYTFDYKAGDPQVILTLRGESGDIPSKELAEYIYRKGVLHVQVVDERGRSDEFYEIDTDQLESESIDSMLSETVSSLNLSEVAQNIEDVVRDMEVSNNKIRDETNTLITDSIVEEDSN